MKKLIQIFVFTLIVLPFSAQQIRYVDTGIILNKIPQYNQAKERLESQVNAWKSEIQKEQEAIDELKLKLENEKIILTEEKIKEKEEVIVKKKEALSKKIEQKFGLNGESNTLRQNLVKPLQDQIWNAINKIAQEKKYDLIFDKNGDATLIYSNSKFDITEMVIKELGLDKVQETKPNKSIPANSKSIKNEEKRNSSQKELRPIEDGLQIQEKK